jgi:hypothetical protein
MREICSFLIMEQSTCPLAVEMFPGKHCDFSTYLAKTARDQSGACAEVLFADYGTVLWSPSSRNVSRNAGNTAISAPNLPRERELSLGHAPRCSFLIMEQCFGPLALEMIPEKHCYFITYLAKSARAHSGTCAKVQFPEYGTEFWFSGSRNGSRKALQFQHLS